MKDSARKGKGNPFKRGSTWTFIYYVTDETGKRHQKWKGGYLTKEDAEIELAKHQFEARTGKRTINSKENDSLKTYMEIWFGIHRRGLKPNSANAYYMDMNKRIFPYIGHLRLKEITPLTLKSLYYQLLDEGLAPKTIARVHSLIKIALQAAIDEGYIYDNPCQKVKPPSIPRYKATILSKEEMQKLITFLSKRHISRYDNAIKLAMLLGLRRGEVLGIKVEDIDFENHTLSIQRQVNVTYDIAQVIEDRKKRTKKTIRKYEKNGAAKYFGLTPPKSDSSIRTLFISPEVEEIFRLQMKIVERIKSKNEQFVDRGLLFCSDFGDVVYPEDLTKRFKVVLEACGLPNMRFHDLRHSYATLCVDMNIPIKTISQSLGHSSIYVTDFIYADSISVKKNLSNIISAEIFGSTETDDSDDSKENEKSDDSQCAC